MWEGSLHHDVGLIKVSLQERTLAKALTEMFVVSLTLSILLSQHLDLPLSPVHTLKAVGGSRTTRLPHPDRPLYIRKGQGAGDPSLF